MTAVPLSTHPLPNTRALEARRQLGAYYTPERLSQILSDWAIRSSADTVLEPSFGGCGFLEASRNRLVELGCDRPVSQIFGCDIDPVAFTYLANVLGSPVDASGFILRDFLDCIDVETWPADFTVVLANPPYIPHHRIGKDRVRELWGRPQVIPGVCGRSGLWAYFLSHAVGRLAVGGRMAWVLPGAFLQADYAEPIRRYLGERFDRCAAILIRERLFLAEGTDEETVILLADGHRRETCAGKIEVGEALALDALEDLIARWTDGAWTGVAGGFSPASLSMSERGRSLFAKLSEASQTSLLGDVARVQIGLVTGDNRFFVLDRPSLEAAGLTEDDCLRVLSKYRAAVGLDLTEDDLDRYAESGGRIHLVTESEPAPGSRVTAYLATFDPERRKTISTFRKRAIWSATSDGKTPDAFLPVMHHTGPRLVLNTEGFNCTNTIHRVFFKDAPDEARRRLIALSMLTTFSQLSAELCGRRYGSGVLKHEPRDAERIVLLLPQADPCAIDTAWALVDARLRAGDPDGARVAADQAVLRWAGMTLSEADAALLTTTLQDIRARRRPERRLKPSVHSTSSPAPSIR